MTHCQFVWYMIVNGFVALGTVGAVIVALFFDHLRAKFWPPVLKLNLLSTVGESVMFRDPNGFIASEGRFYHLRVDNSRRWAPATDVGVHLVRIDKRGPDAEFEPEWQGDVQIGCRDQGLYPLQREVGSPVDYDLFSVKGEVPPELRLHPILAPNKLVTARNQPWEFVAWFQAKSSQMDSSLVRIQDSWDGKWEKGEKEMQTHLKIKQLAS